MKTKISNRKTKKMSSTGETSVYIQTNTFCNQKCVFCNRPPTESYQTGLSTNLTDIKNKIKELSSEPTVKRIIFTGGEPLLYPQLVEAITYAKKYKFITEIQTNGTLLSLDKLKTLKKAGLDIINFALHSHLKRISNKLRGVKFGYENIIQNIKLADGLEFEIHVIHVITSLNYKDLPAFIDFIYRMRLVHLNLNLSIVVPEGWAWKNKWIIPRIKNVKPYLQQAMKKCISYNIYFDVSEVVPLCIMQGFENHAVSTVFKLKNTKITDDYITGQRDLNFANLNPTQAIKAPQCRKCSFNSICAGFYPRLKELYGTNDFKPRKDKPEFVIESIMNSQQ